MSTWQRQYEWLCEALDHRGIDVPMVEAALAAAVIELPSWAVGNSGTRYGVFREDGAARHIWDRIDDCAEIQKLTGVAPRMAVHVSWDVTEDGRYGPVRSYAEQKGLGIGTVHPNTFLGQQFRLGSICSPDSAVRKATAEHMVDCVRIAREMGSRTIGVWIADGTNYPGQDHLRTRKHRLVEGMDPLYAAMDDDMTLLVEYKLFEPSFYTMDLMDWGMSLLLCNRLGPRAKVLVDLGHHALGVNIEQIVAVLIDEGRIGGFHLNNRKYADDDLMAGSCNPLELFLIYDQIVDATADPIAREVAQAIVYMLDQSHNIEPSIEGLIQSVMNTQTAHAKALIVDRPRLRALEDSGDVVGANRLLMEAFETDIQPLLKKTRVDSGRDPDPLVAYRESGYARRIAEERAGAARGTLGGD